MSGRRSGGGGGGGRTVNVSGYTRSDGRVVAGYTRSAPSSRGSSASSSVASGMGSGVVQVSGYTRSNGTYVQGYNRSTPSSSTGSQSGTAHSRTSTGSDVIHVMGHYRSNGTYVEEHTRSRPQRSGNGSSSKSTGHTATADQTQMRSAGNGVGSVPSVEASRSRVYVDNAFNRRVGRVGKPLGTHILSKSSISSLGSAGEERKYVDNDMNRKLGRVGKVIPKRSQKQQEILEDNTYETLLDTLQNLGLADVKRADYESALGRLSRAEVEEQWKSCGIEPLTDVEVLETFTPGIIPYDELKVNPRPIGRGAFGSVYAAAWRGTPVAFKELLYQRMAEKRRESFVQETTILAALDHPNTVKLFGAVVDKCHLGIVMEYLPRSLFHAIFVDETRFEDAIKKRLVTHIADALQYLHRNHIVHCDVKSENVLLDKEDNAKLSDFGLSAVKSATESSRSSQPAPPGQGTPRYSAPEVLRGKLLTFEQLRLADVYSLGIVAFEVLAEEEPFEGLNMKQLEENVGRGNLRPDVPARVSETIQELLQRCWDEEAGKRPAAEEFKELWETADLYNA